MSFHVFGNWLVEKSGFTVDYVGTSVAGTLVEAYSRQATLALKEEFHRVGRQDRAILPQFTDFRDLSVQHDHSAQKHAGIENALVCATQLCKYIRYASQRLNILLQAKEDSFFENSSYAEPANRNKHFVAFGIGGFAALAAATSDTPAAVVSNAVRATLLAFRLGTFVDQMAKNILHLDTETAGSDSWAYEFAVTKDHALPLLAGFYVENVSQQEVQIELRKMSNPVI